MKRLISIVLNFASLVFFLYILVAARNKYEWMIEVDPEISRGAIEDASGNGAITAAIAVFIILLCQVGVYMKSKESRSAVFPLVISVLAVIVWLIKFY